MDQVFEAGTLSQTWIIVGIAAIAVILLFVVAEWRILTKAGEKGWKSLIPFYNVFISHHIVGMSHVWFILEVVFWIGEVVIEFAAGAVPGQVTAVFGVVTGVFTLVSELVHILKLCSCFGKGTGFKIGMILFPNLFFLILAYGKSAYRKPVH